MSPAQSRAARALLDWSTGDLARRTGLAESFIQEFEAGRGDPASGQVEALRSALMAAGIVFTEGDGSGVRLDRSAAGDEGVHPDRLTTENDR